jgi:hypothetical protein
MVMGRGIKGQTESYKVEGRGNIKETSKRINLKIAIYNIPCTKKLLTW